MSLMMLSIAEKQALWLSAKVASTATLLCLPMALGLAWLLARREFMGKLILETLIQLPMVLPPVVPGYLLLLVFGTEGVVGSCLEQYFGVVLAFTWQGAALAAAVMAFPLMVQPMRLAFRLVDPRFEAMARTLGAPPWRAFLQISFPLALPGMVAGMVLGFSRCLGEFGATMAFVGNIPDETRTLPLAIYSLMHQLDGEPAAWRLIVLSLLLAFGAILSSHFLNHRLEQRLGYQDKRGNDAGF